jgi:general stress protein 26
MTASTSEDLRERFWAEIGRTRTGMLGVIEGEETRFQPMTAHFGDRSGTFWFYARGDGVITELAQSGRAANFTYVGGGHDLFACLHGMLKVETDKAMGRKFWTEEVARWFPEGPDSDYVALLRFDAEGADIWLPEQAQEATRMGFGSRDRPEDVRASVPLS